MASQKKPHQATEGKPKTKPPTEDDPGPKTYPSEAYPSARFIHGAFHPRYFLDDPPHAEPGD